jgi:hypothetical protein
MQNTWVTRPNGATARVVDIGWGHRTNPEKNWRTTPVFRVQVEWVTRKGEVKRRWYDIDQVTEG